MRAACEVAGQAAYVVAEQAACVVVALAPCVVAERAACVVEALAAEKCLAAAAAGEQLRGEADQLQGGWCRAVSMASCYCYQVSLEQHCF